jgi:hypothetical protein
MAVDVVVAMFVVIVVDGNRVVACAEGAPNPAIKIAPTIKRLMLVTPQRKKGGSSDKEQRTAAPRA